MIQLSANFDPNSARHQSRLIGDAHVEPLVPVHVVNGARTITVWIATVPIGNAGWSIEVLHRAGAWPLAADEKRDLEFWIEEFAKEHWPDRTLIFPPDYKTERKTKS